MNFSDYTDYKNQQSSEKCVLVKQNAAQRLVGWVLHSGSIYKLDGYAPDSLEEIAQEETLYTEVNSLGAVIASTYYWDREAAVLYLHTTGSVNPNSVYIASKIAYYFSNLGSISAPHDFASGYEVNFRPLVESTSQFGVELDNSFQIGIAIEGKGSVSYYNDQSFWENLYDKVYFENQVCLVWSWNRTLPISQAKLLYRGRVESRSFSKAQIKINLADTLNELQSPIIQPDYSELVGAIIPEDLESVKQRMLFGYVYQLRPINIDQEVDGYLMTGTMTPTVGSDQLVGVGTNYLLELHPGDEIIIGYDIEDSYKIKSIESATAVTLGENYKGLIQSGVTSLVLRGDDIQNHWYNREFKIACHALREPTTEIVGYTNFRFIEVADSTDIEAGDEIIIGGTERSIVDYVSGNQIKLVLALVTPPAIGATVVRPAIQNVYLDGKKLLITRDYTYSAANGTLSLAYKAELNVTRGRPLTGTIAFTTTSRLVVGVGTLFKSEIRPGDWIKSSSLGDDSYFEVLQVLTDTTLHLKTPSDATTASLAGIIRAPKYYVEDDKEGSIFVCDVLGRTENGLTSGTFLKTGPMIVKALLIDLGLTDLISNSAFATASLLATARLGLALPEKFDGTESPKSREVMNRINVSIFGSLVQSEDFALEYKVLRPARPISSSQVKERDVLTWSVKSDSTRLARTASVQWGNYDRDIDTGLPVVLTAQEISKSAAYLAKTQKDYLVKSFITRARDAEILAARYAFMVEAASSIISLKTKLRYARLQVTDGIDFEHEKLYTRLGTNENRKFANIQSIKKSAEEIDMVIEDLANAFTRVCVITENDVESWDLSDGEERFLNGFITDPYGMMDNDKDTYGFNLIW